MTSREEILSGVRKFVETKGKVPGEKAFRRATRIKDSAWKGRYWVRWSDVVREAGFEPSKWIQKIPDEDLLEKLAAFVTTLDHFPVRDEINIQARRVHGFPYWATIRKRYSGMPETAAALLKFSKKTGDTHLAELCEHRLRHAALKPTPVGKARTKPVVGTGFVYLKYSPSLRLYKIGKANDADKRGAGIGLLLPEDLVPKHEIKTDYPYVLERYWENRFRSKRKQGEWYDLNSHDVDAFKKRRTFMFNEFFPEEL
jgi:hypothetical protein